LTTAASIPGTTADPRPATRVLVGDDLPHICDALALLLKGAGYKVDVGNSPQELLTRAREGVHDLILMDMNYARDTTSGEEGLDLLERLQALSPGVPVIVMTAWSTVELAVQAMQRGARDFVTKPWDNDRLVALVGRHLEQAREQRRATQAARSEREIARDVQQRLLPKPRQQWGSVVCECVCRPALDIGGDLYDVLECSPHGAAFVLADVCGKGVGSALMMAGLQATIRAEWGKGIALEELLRRVNRLFFRSTRPEHYATLFFGLYEENGRRLRYVNCGHPEPILARAGGRIDRLAPTGTVVGAFPEAAYNSDSTQLHPGDVLVLFSDGVIEAPVDGVDYGDERLVRRIVESRASGAAGLVEAILGDVLPGNSNGQYDDITLMVLAAG
jgi:serine phosphatase RsbU (regulator of sigma subunit)